MRSYPPLSPYRGPAGPPSESHLLLRLPADRTWEGFITTPLPLAILTHYVDEKSVVCRGHSGVCVHCAEGRDRRERGYVSYYNMSICRHHILEVTSGVLDSWSAAGLVSPDCELLGLWCTFTRVPATTRGRILAKWDKTKRPLFKLPVPLEVDRIVGKIYGLK